MNTTREILGTALGPLFVGASEAGLHRVDFVRPERDETWLDAALEIDAARAGADARAGSARATLSRALGQLDAYFGGRAVEFALPLAPHGTAFQLAVWEALRAIPPGERRSYRQIAGAVARPAGARAVGQAVGRNPLAVVVPCHRVVGSDGSLTGYAGGIERKQWLLARDAAASGGPAR